ncbi:Putative ribonuclease H protein At1g65750 [Linum perenne]
MGGAWFNQARSRSFIDTVDVCGLLDIPFTGPKFTWSRSNVFARLDRALVNSAWLQCCPDSSVSHLHKLKSDHRSILLRPHVQVFSPNVKPFRFIATWLSHVSFNVVLSNKWNAGSDFPKNLADFTDVLKRWNKRVFGNINYRKNRLVEDLKRAEAWVLANPSDANRQQESSIRSNLEMVLSQEELLWVQKSRVNWIVEGDRNTRFFQLATIKHRSVNRITKLKDASGDWVDDPEQLLALTDRWVDSGAILIDHATNLQGVDSTLSVSDFCLNNGMWDFPKLRECLPESVVWQVYGMTPPRTELGEDAKVWGLESNGRFSVKSAYNLIKDFDSSIHGNRWSKIWKWDGPNKVRHFMWLVSHDKLMTNAERAKRRFTDVEECGFCNQGREDINHILRCCSFAQEVWRKLLPQAVSSDQSAWNFRQWWDFNLDNGASGQLFGFAAWLLWRRRNRWVFYQVAMGVEEVIGQVRFWVQLWSSSWKARQLSLEAPGQARQTQLIGWRLGGEGWFTLNSDGSLHTSSNSATEEG